MPRPGPARVCGWMVVCAGFLVGQSGFAADLPGARLEVVRGPGAESCPDADAVAGALRERLGSAGLVEGAPVVIEVEIRSTGKEFTSTVRASGGKRGVRSLNAAGPSCDGLYEALVVSLLVLLDRDPERPRVEERSPRSSEGARLSLWLAGGSALTYDLPDGFSGALFGEVGARYEPHALWAGAIFAPEREIFVPPGFVGVSAIGGQLRACTLLFGTEAIRTDACAVGLLLALRGSARGYTQHNPEVRPWWLVGAGAELAFLPSPWLAAGLSGRLLIAPKTEVFSIKGLGDVYETKTAIGWLGLSLSAKIW